MKAIYNLLFILSIFTSQIYSQDVYHGCAMQGTAIQSDVQALNELKNRYNLPTNSDFDNSITLNSMLQPGYDVNRFSTDKAAEIEGYVLNVKVGGKETCNCGASIEKYKDIHIEIVPTKKTTTYKKKVIIEVTPRLRQMIFDQLGITATVSQLKSYIKGKKVKIKGWMLFDKEHILEAEHTDPGDYFGRANWRATCWEIHPITSLELTN